MLHGYIYITFTISMGILKGQCHKINYHVGSCKLSFSPEQGLYTGFKFVKSSLKRQK